MRTSVLVVGGGVVGLTGALFLARHGVPCVLVERHPDLLIRPRARGLMPRTMEVYRQAGLEQAIRDAAFGGGGFAYVPVRANTLPDDEYTIPDEPHEDDGSAASPCGFGPIDQDRLEILVRDRARDFGADLRFATELTSFTQHGDDVTATVTDRATGATATIDQPPAGQHIDEPRQLEAAHIGGFPIGVEVVQQVKLGGLFAGLTSDRFYWRTGCIPVVQYSCLRARDYGVLTALWRSRPACCRWVDTDAGKRIARTRLRPLRWPP